jgi:hypothetical protein
MQGTVVFSRTKLLTSLPGFLQGRFGRQGDETIQLWIHLLNAIQASLGKFERRDLACLDQVRGFG